MDSGMNELPKTLRLLMVFIDRVGFPVLAFLLMFFYAYQTLNKMTVAVSEMTANIKLLSDKNTSQNDAIIRAIRDVDAGRRGR